MVSIPIPRSSLDSIPTSFATVSVGTPSTPLSQKLSAISSAGFQAIELGFPDLLSFASSHFKKEIDDHDWPSLCEAGADVKALCETNGLRIMMLQPFSNFEGWPEGSAERDDAFERASGWIKIMKAIGTDLLQVGSSDSLSISTSPDRVACDLRALADLLAPHSFRLAYEPWAWSTHAPTWKSTWNIVKLVDRPNVGLCLDTFQIAGHEWADPTTMSGLVDSKGFQQKLEMNFAGSLIELANTVPKEKIYLLQISDAYKMSVPLKPDVENGKGEVVGDGEDGLRARGRWSHDYRPYPYNGGYLPVVRVAKAVLSTGFRGWFSVEVFDSGADGKRGPGAGQREGMSEEMTVFCRGAMKSHTRLLDECADSGRWTPGRHARKGSRVTLDGAWKP